MLSEGLTTSGAHHTLRQSLYRIDMQRRLDKPSRNACFTTLKLDVDVNQFNLKEPTSANFDTDVKRIRLIVNADDFGASEEVNEAVIRAFQEGVLTSCSLMVTGEAFNHAEVVGITAGASAPEEIVFRVLKYLRSLGTPDVEGLEAVDEHIHFALPAELAQSAHSS